MNTTFEFGSFFIIISVIIRIIAGLYYLIRVLPRQIAEAQIHDAVYKLRIQFLVSGIILFSLNTIGLVILLIRPLISPEGLVITSNIITITNSLGFLFIFFIKDQIYHQEYPMISISTATKKRKK